MTCLRHHSFPCRECRAEETTNRKAVLVRAISSVAPEVRNLVRLLLIEVAANIRECERSVDVYYGSDEEKAATGAYNDAISTVARAIETEVACLEDTK